MNRSNRPTIFQSHNDIRARRDIVKYCCDRLLIAPKSCYGKLQLIILSRCFNTGICFQIHLARMVSLRASISHAHTSILLHCVCRCHSSSHSLLQHPSLWVQSSPSRAWWYLYHCGCDRQAAESAHFTRFQNLFEPHLRDLPYLQPTSASVVAPAPSYLDISTYRATFVSQIWLADNVCDRPWARIIVIEQQRDVRYCV